MRDRLIELLNNIASTHYEGDKIVVPEMDVDDRDINRIADFLLENGVVVLPFNIGDEVYDAAEFVEKVFTSWEVYELKDNSITIKKDKNNKYSFTYDAVDFNFDEVGKTIFRTKEEVEQVLKGDER